MGNAEGHEAGPIQRRGVAEYARVEDLKGIDAMPDDVVVHDPAEAFDIGELGHRPVSTGTARAGKWLQMSLNGPSLVGHFGMTGSFVGTWPKSAIAMIGWCSAWGAELHYRDLRKLRGLWPLPPGSGIDTISGPQGPDALGVSLASLLKRLASRRGIKVVLMDQSKLAGLGNMLSDEVLWRSRIYPAQPANTLDEVEIRRLYSALTATLRASVRAEHVPRTSQWLASQRDRRDPQCPQCDAVLQRTSGWPNLAVCPLCQVPHTA